MKPQKRTAFTYQSGCRQITPSETHTVHIHTKCVKEGQRASERQREVRNKRWRNVRDGGDKCVPRLQNHSAPERDCVSMSVCMCMRVCVHARASVFLCLYSSPSLFYYFCPVAMATTILMLVCMCLGNVKLMSRLAETALSTPQSCTLPPLL